MYYFSGYLPSYGKYIFHWPRKVSQVPSRMISTVVFFLSDLPLGKLSNLIHFFEEWISNLPAEIEMTL